MGLYQVFFSVYIEEADFAGIDFLNVSLADVFGADIIKESRDFQVTQLEPGFDQR